VYAAPFPVSVSDACFIGPGPYVNGELGNDGLEQPRGFRVGRGSGVSLVGGSEFTTVDRAIG
jgi:hypothetical protein